MCVLWLCELIQDMGITFAVCFDIWLGLGVHTHTHQQQIKTIDKCDVHGRQTTTGPDGWWQFFAIFRNFFSSILRALLCKCISFLFLLHVHRFQESWGRTKQDDEEDDDDNEWWWLIIIICIFHCRKKQISRYLLQIIMRFLIRPLNNTNINIFFYYYLCKFFFFQIFTYTGHISILLLQFVVYSSPQSTNQ